MADLERHGAALGAWIEDIERASGRLRLQLIREFMNKVDNGEMEGECYGRCSAQRHGGEREGRQHRQDG